MFSPDNVRFSMEHAQNGIFSCTENSTFVISRDRYFLVHEDSLRVASWQCYAKSNLNLY